MNLHDFTFPVTERPVAVFNGQNDLIDLDNRDTYLDNEYKAIVREDTNKLISIVKPSYKIIPNEVLINNLMEKLSDLDTPHYIDKSHSFAQNNRMRLQVTFPEITMKDNESEIALSLFLHNSYDMSEGVRMFFGAIRYICSNGMVFGKMLGQFYSRHTSGFAIEEMEKALLGAYEKIPEIQAKIQELESKSVTRKIREAVKKELGKKMAEQVLVRQRISQWQLLNLITHIISHTMEQRLRARYQIATARIFGL